MTTEYVPTGHRRAPLWYEGCVVWIDVGIVYRIRELWAAGIRTYASCQGGHEDGWTDAEGRPEAYAMVSDPRAVEVVPGARITHGPDTFLHGRWWLMRWAV
jgi:hypothetical protein